eukprot:1637932-Prymnesium_polylepis.1
MRGQAGVSDGCDGSFTVKRRRARQRPLPSCMLMEWWDAQDRTVHRPAWRTHRTQYHGLTGR